jgi:hypothetical protein
MNDQSPDGVRVVAHHATHAANQCLIAHRYKCYLMLDVLHDGGNIFQEGWDLAGPRASPLFRKRKLLQFVYRGRVRDPGATDGKHRIVTPDDYELTGSPPVTFAKHDTRARWVRSSE